jgi:hypothetical protein
MNSRVVRKLYQAEFEKRLVAQYLCSGVLESGRRFIYDGDNLVLPEGSSIFYIGLTLAATHRNIAIATSNQLLIEEYFSNPELASSFSTGFLTVGGYPDKSECGGSDQGAVFKSPAEFAFEKAIEEDPGATVVLIPVSGITLDAGPFATKGDVSSLKKKIIQKSVLKSVREVIIVCDWRKQLHRDGEGYGAPVFSQADWKDLLKSNEEKHFLSLVTTPTPRVRELVLKGQLGENPYNRQTTAFDGDDLSLSNDDRSYIRTAKGLYGAFSGQMYEALKFTEYASETVPQKIAIAVSAKSGDDLVSRHGHDPLGGNPRVPK